MIVPTLTLEKSLWRQGYRNIVGIDEVGRGSWAGPLVAAGVIFPQNVNLPKGLADSKLIPAKKRVKLAKLIKNLATATLIVEIPSQKLDRIFLARAAQVAFRKIVYSIRPKPDYCLIDAFYIKHLAKNRQEAVRGGDKICASIAAASIIAKVYRDNLMVKYHTIYPNYGFASHKGYGTLEHQKAIRSYGFTKIHRMSYKLKYLYG